VNSEFCSLLLELAAFGDCNCHNLVCFQFHYTLILTVHQSDGDFPSLFVMM